MALNRPLIGSLVFTAAFWTVVGVSVLHGLALQTGCQQVTPTAGGDKAILAVSPQALELSTLVGVPLPSQAVQISNAGKGALKWDIGPVSQPWLTVSPTSGINDTTVLLAIQTSALIAGEHAASFEVTAPDQVPAPVNVRVVLSTTPPVEVCGDQLDNDGDGQIDENPPCVPPDPTGCPSGATTVAVGSSIQAALDAQPTGGTVCLATGVHRLLAALTPKANQTLTGAAGAILSGARLLTSFERSGALWVAPNQTQQGGGGGVCRSQNPRCNLVEDLYLDDVMLKHVATPAEVKPGAWYFDYGADRIYFADDPTGKRVETTLTRHAIMGSAATVTIANLTIEKFATPAQAGAVNGEQSDGWVVRDTIIRFNHGIGLRIGHRMRVERTKLLSNGQMGIGGVGDDVLVVDNEIARNNTAGYDSGWEAGGTKFVKTQRLIVRNNRSHHNDGPGLWTDIDNVNTLYEGNTVEDNVREGIYHEISYAAIIRTNIIKRNGFGAPSGWLFGAGILIAASPNVEVLGNTLEGNATGITCIQQNRGGGTIGPYLTQNLHVHDNTVTGGVTGCAQDVGDTAVFTSRNNRFVHNTYYLKTSHPFAWMNGYRTEQEWVGYGQDTTGTFQR